MLRPPRKLLPVLLAVLAALLLSACGDSHTKVTTGTYAGESGANAPYLNVGPLIYQVQLSRELNPYNTEDATYLEGLTPAQRKLETGEEWFGVFIQIFNNGSRSEPTATSFTVSDTQRNVYEPIVPGPTNAYAFRPGLVPAGARVPALDTPPSNGPTQGVLLLYKIQIVSLDNRPLELKITDPTDAAESASAELDV